MDIITGRAPPSHEPIHRTVRFFKNIFRPCFFFPISFRCASLMLGVDAKLPSIAKLPQIAFPDRVCGGVTILALAGSSSWLVLCGGVPAWPMCVRVRARVWCVRVRVCAHGCARVCVSTGRRAPGYGVCSGSPQPLRRPRRHRAPGQSRVDCA